MAVNIRQYLSESTPTSFAYRDGSFKVEGARTRGAYALWVNTPAATYQVDAGIQGRAEAMGIAWAIFNLRFSIYRRQLGHVINWIEHEQDTITAGDARPYLNA